MSNQVQNQPTAAYWLSIIGSVIGILASLALFALGAIAYSAIGAFEDLFGYGYYDYSASAIGWGFAFYFAIGAWCLISSILVFIFASKLKANPLAHGKYGLLIL